jgi:chromosomal replication initiator protein
LDALQLDLQRLWAETLLLAEGDLPRPSFETWLRRARPLALYDDLLVISTDSEFARAMAERHSALLRQRLSQAAGRPMNLTFVIPPKDAGRDREDPAPAVTPPPPPTLPAATATPAVEPAYPPPNPRYTFETFVVAPNCYLSYSAAVAVAEAPARVYNPLFIYGGVGLGKTHLLQAIANRVLQRSATARVAYVSSETFANELINAIKDRTTEEFRNRYRNVDVLLVDDVQFLAGKESTQEEFFHTFNRLYEADKQIVLTSDHPPKEIATLEERLRSRFEWGLITDIQPPDLETRTAILRKKAELERLPIPNEAIRYIAERINTNIRELEGALVRVVAYASLHNRPMDAALAQEALRDILPEPQPRQITIRLIQETVAEFYDLDVKDLKIRKRTRNVAFPRQVAMYLCRELTDASLPKIGEEFGGRDHTTVIHAHEKISRALAADPALRATIQTLRKRILG